MEEKEEEEEAEEAEAEAEEVESEVEEAAGGGQHSGGRWKTSSLPSMTTRRGSHTICVLRMMLRVEGRRNVCRSQQQVRSELEGRRNECRSQQRVR